MTRLSESKVSDLILMLSCQEFLYFITFEILCHASTQQIKVMLSRFTVSFRPFFHVSYSVSSRLYFLPVDLKHSFILVANMMRTGDTIKNERVSIVTTQYALVITDILSLLDM